MEETRTQAFVLRTRSYGESDLIVTLLTLELGKTASIAKGARRSKRRFAGGALEPFQELDVRLTRKPHANLAFLHESRVLGSNAAIAGDLDAYAWASYLPELTELLTVDRDPCPDLYRLYAELLPRLRTEARERAVHHFLVGLLDRTGWAPDLDSCGICAEPITPYSRPMLDQRGSGVVCARHEAEHMGVDPEDPSWRPSRRVIEPELLDYVRAAREGVPPEGGLRLEALATALLDRLVHLHLGRPLKSRAFLVSLRAGAATPPDIKTAQGEGDGSDDVAAQAPTPASDPDTENSP